MRSVLFFVFAGLLLTSCERQKESSGLYFDSLIVNQIKHLQSLHVQVEKRARVDHMYDSSVLKMDSLRWKKELDVFTQLDVFQKPAFTNAYVVTTGPDDHSNLIVKSYQAKPSDIPISVKSLQFFYLTPSGPLKKIKAVFSEDNSFYFTHRTMELFFENHEGKSLISHYSVQGTQKMILADSVQFEVKGRVLF
jgi:hypothetical protein